MEEILDDSLKSLNLISKRKYTSLLTGPSAFASANLSPTYRVFEF